MLESTRQKVKNTRLYLVGFIVSLLLSLTLFLILQFAVGKEELGFAPIFSLFFGTLLLSGLFFIILSLTKKRTFLLATGGGLFLFGLLILLLCLKVLWWVVLIICLVLTFALFLSTFITKAPQLVLEFDNAPDVERLPYEERLAQKKKEEAEKEQKPLPEIKSFKD